MGIIRIIGRFIAEKTIESIVAYQWNVIRRPFNRLRLLWYKWLI